MVTGSQIAELVLGFQRDVLGPRFSRRTVTEVAEALEERLCDAFLDTTTNYGDFKVDEAFLYTPKGTKLRRGSAVSLLLEYFFEHEGRMFTRAEIKAAIPKPSCVGALSRLYLHLNDSSHYELITEGYRPRRYGVKRIQEAHQDT